MDPIGKAEDEEDAPPETVITVVSLSPAWFLLRAFRATASMVSVLIGLGKMSRPAGYWKRIVETPLERGEDPAPCIHGRITEPLVIIQTARRTGLQILDSSYHTDRVYPWLGATPDGYVKHDTLILRADRGVNLDPDYLVDPDKMEAPVEGPEALIECKAPYFRAYDGVPLDYLIQTFVQMRVTGVRVTYLTAYWANGRCMMIWRITWSGRVWRWIERRLLRFIACLYNRVEPTDYMIPHLYKENQQLLKENFSHASRLRIATEAGISPKLLLPPVFIETITKDEDPFYYLEGKPVERALLGL